MIMTLKNFILKETSVTSTTRAKTSSSSSTANSLRQLGTKKQQKSVEKKKIF